MGMLQMLGATEWMSLVYLLGVIGLVWLFWRASKKQAVFLKKFDECLRLQVGANRQIDAVVNELRRSNRLLAELADMRASDISAIDTNDAYRISKIAGAHTGHANSNNMNNTSSSNSSGVQTAQGGSYFTQKAAASSTGVDSLYKLYVGNIDYKATEAELESYFASYGEIESVNIPVNRYTGRPRGFGFVTFVSEEDAKQAMILNGTEFKGRHIQVNFAKEREADALKVES